MKFKAVICALNSKYIHSSLAPWCLYTAFKSAGIMNCECKVIEGTINEKVENIYERISAETPQLVAFSCYIWNIERTLALAEKLKVKGITIALGKSQISLTLFSAVRERSFSRVLFRLFLKEKNLILKVFPIEKTTKLQFQTVSRLILKIPSHPIARSILKPLQAE